MTPTIKIEVENMKCGGCERSIFNGLDTIEGISGVAIDREHQTIEFNGPARLRPIVAAKLRAMGYPEKGSVHGLGAGLANAKSLVSCAIGRVS